MDLTRRADRGPVALGITVVLCLALFALAVAAPQATAADVGYTYYVYGSPADKVTDTRPGLLLAGGASDQDGAMQWWLGRAGGGDVVVIAASGTDDYDAYIYDTLGGVDSCETFILGTRKASYDRFFLDKLAKAEAIFIDGGNQWLYYDYMVGTPAEKLINEAAQTRPVGGISAGLAVQGQFAYVAQKGSITSKQALANPYHSHVTLVSDFLRLPYLDAVITDSHFVARDRMGRHLTFLARIVNDGWTPEARGIAVDEDNTVTVDEMGTARLYGAGAAYYTRTNGTPQVCAKNLPLTYADISVYRLTSGATFDLTRWTGRGGAAYSVSAVAGVLTSTQPGGSVY
jgi:cyanophycinase-like exopeptidase